MSSEVLRHCNKCGLDKPRTEFYAEKKRPGILSPRCKPWDRDRSKSWNRANPERHSENQRRYSRNSQEYQRNYLLKRKFGISQDDYLTLLERQGGGCAICGTKVPGGRGQFFHVDHDHLCCPGERSCGRCIRGLLCHEHNTGLGLFHDDVVALKSAVAYLERRHA